MSVKTIEEYTSTLDEKAKLNLENFINFMESSYPNIRPKISFSMPMWLKGTRMNEGYIAISHSKNYFSIHFSDEETVNHLSDITGCKHGKRCINISYEDTSSFDTVKETVRQYLKKCQRLNLRHFNKFG
ncbi:MAG: DUF1801 domain-containing protein [Solobacterium sp.]|nr:DUF1801 domain-containing protein [Solobacterium sp.]